MNNLLTPKQQKFVEEYLIDLNGSAAAVRAGYSQKTAKEQASRLLTNVNIKSEIEERRSDLSKKNEYTQELHLSSNKKMIQAYELLLDLSMQPRLSDEEEMMFSRMMLVLKASDANKAKEITNKMMGWEKRGDDSNDDSDDDNEFTVTIVR